MTALKFIIERFTEDSDYLFGDVETLEEMRDELKANVSKALETIDAHIADCRTKMIESCICTECGKIMEYEPTGSVTTVPYGNRQVVESEEMVKRCRSCGFSVEE